MSQENVEVVRAGYEAYGKEDFEALVPLLHPKFVFHERPNIPGGGVHHGAEGLRTLLTALREDVGMFEFRPSKLVDTGEKVAALLGMTLKSKGGVELAYEGAHVWTFSTGKVIRLDSYATHREALEAVGLSERTMSQENVEIVRWLVESNYSEHLEDRMDEVLELWAPDCEYISVLGTVDQEIYKGHDGLRRYLGDMTAAWSEWRNVLGEISEVDPGVVLATFQELRFSLKNQPPRHRCIPWWHRAGAAPPHDSPSHVAGRFARCGPACRVVGADPPHGPPHRDSSLHAVDQFGPLLARRLGEGDGRRGRRVRPSFRAPVIRRLVHAWRALVNGRRERCGAVLRAREKLADLVIPDLGEVAIAVADAPETTWRTQADDLVCARHQLVAGRCWSNGHSHNHPSGPAATDRGDRGLHACSRGQAVVNQDGDLVGELQ